MLHQKVILENPPHLPLVETIQTTAQKHSKTLITFVPPIPKFECQDFETFTNMSTPKRTTNTHNQDTTKPRSKIYTLEWSIINILIVVFCCLMLMVIYWDYSAKRAKLLADIRFQIKECTSNFQRNKCSEEGSHLKFQQVYQKCFKLKECQHLDPHQELGRRESVSGFIGQIIRDFFNGIGLFYLSALIVLILAVGYVSKGKQRLSYQTKIQ